MTAKESFQATFEQLKDILKPFEPQLVVGEDTSNGYSLNTPYNEQYKQELFFGAAQIKKNYVSYYLMPVYMFPDLLAGISPALKKRMQGKSCFNFKTIAPELLQELTQLTGQSFARFKQELALTAGLYNK
jgi:hypothetical protein